MRGEYWLKISSASARLLTGLTHFGEKVPICSRMTSGFSLLPTFCRVFGSTSNCSPTFSISSTIWRNSLIRCSSHSRRKAFIWRSTSRFCSSLRCVRRLKCLAPITMPSWPAGNSSESFFTSSPARPKIACSSFSSGESSVLLFGETLPTRMSLGPTRVPSRTIPRSSRLRSARSETLGMSRVNSSRPSFVSRISMSCDSMWMLVNESFFTRRSEIRIASS